MWLPVGACAGSWVPVGLVGACWGLWVPVGVWLWGVGLYHTVIVCVTAQMEWSVGPNGYRVVPHWGCCYGGWGLHTTVFGVTLQSENG